MTGQAQTTNLVMRNDTILGVCEAMGQDFGFNANCLRLAFCAPIYWNPGLVIATYLALGLLVAATRYAFPDRTLQVHASQEAAGPVQAQVEEERQLIAA